MQFAVVNIKAYCTAVGRPFLVCICAFIETLPCPVSILYQKIFENSLPEQPYTTAPYFLVFGKYAVVLFYSKPPSISFCFSDTSRRLSFISFLR